MAQVERFKFFIQKSEMRFPKGRPKEHWVDVYRFECDNCGSMFSKNRRQQGKTFCNIECRKIDKGPSKKRISIDEVKLRLFEIHGDTVTIDETTYISSDKKARFIDKDYGEWWANVKSICRGRRHTKYKSVAAKNAHLSTVDELKEKLLKVHGEIVTLVDGQIYIGSHHYMMFKDIEYGLWKAWPSSVCLGHGHPDRGQHNKAKNAKKSIVVNHWKTGENLVCVGSYELAFVIWLNENQIDFDWQIPFKTDVLTSKGKKSTYYVDAYIKTGELANTYIEIKGTFNRKNGQIGKLKWEWFHENYPNSQIWFRSDLLSRGILVK